MTTIGKSYEDYKAEHPLTENLADGLNPYHASLAIYEAIGTDKDFFEPKLLSTLSEEALESMSAELGNIAGHFDNIAYYSIHGNSATDQGIEDLYLNGAGNKAGAAELLAAVPLEHDTLVVGLLKRDFVEGGQPPAAVRESINNGVTGFKNAYKQGLDAAWEMKADMNNLVEDLAGDWSEANAALHQGFLKDLSPEQQDYFKTQINAFGAQQGVDAETLAEMNEVLGRAFNGELDLEAILELDVRSGAEAAHHSGHETGHSHSHLGSSVAVYAHHIIEHSAEAHAAGDNHLRNHKKDILEMTEDQQSELRSEIKKQGGTQVEGGFLDQKVLDNLLGDYDKITAEGHASLDSDRGRDTAMEAPAAQPITGMQA